MAFFKGLLSYSKAFLGAPILLKAFFKGLLPLLKGLFRGFYDLKAFSRASYRFLNGSFLEDCLISPFWDPKDEQKG